MREIVFGGNLAEIPVKNKYVGIINHNGVPRVAINFPKSADHIIFVRGRGIDSSDKSEMVAGIK